MGRPTVEERSPAVLNPGVRGEVIVNLSHSESELGRKAALSQQAEQDEALFQACDVWIASRDSVNQTGGSPDVDHLPSAAADSIRPTETGDQRVERSPSQRELNGQHERDYFRGHDEVQVRQPEEAR